MTYTQPLLLAFLVITAAGAWRWRRRGVPSRLVPAGLAGLFLACWPPAAWVFSRPLESRYAPGRLPDGDAQAIVALSATVLWPAPGLPEAIADRDTYERTLYAAWLYKHWRPLPILTSGGSDRPEQTPAADVMRRILLGEGVPESMIWTEGRSHSTWENALFSAAILRAKGVATIALSTEAAHMPRAAASFRKQGLRVLPAPCGFYGLEWRQKDVLPNYRGIRQNEAILHEYLGLVWYKLRGRM